MNQLYLLPFFYIGFILTTQAQVSTISFNEELNQVHNGVPLPAEQKLLLVAKTPPSVDLVELRIYKSKADKDRSPIYSNRWKRPFDNQSTEYRLPINYRLPAGKEFDFTLGYYSPLTVEQRQRLFELLRTNLGHYVDQSLQVGKKKLLFEKKTKHLIDDLNTLVFDGLSNYRSTNTLSFDGFSDIVRGQLEKIENSNLKTANRVVEGANQEDAQRKYRQQLIGDLKKMLETEVQFVLHQEWNALVQEFEITAVETEKRSGYFSLNVGYGGVYLDGNLDNLSYDSAPYLGLAFPLSTSTLAPKFFRNASITLGIFTRNFEDELEQTITGPLIKRPVYLGLDYKIFQFVRFNAGAAFLEEANDNNGQISGIEKRVFIQPFVGLSAKVNITVGLDK